MNTLTATAQSQLQLPARAPASARTVFRMLQQLRHGSLTLQLPDGSVVKAKELSGKNGILYRRDSQSGALHAIPRKQSWGELNAELHKN